MMATTAIHMLGDISRETPDLCIVAEEDDDNYYGNWVTGFGYIDVKFPKSTTKELTPEEVEKYDGQLLTLNGEFFPTINISGEDFRKHVVVTKEGSDKVITGTLIAPIKHVIAMIRDDGRMWTTSKIKQIEGNRIVTKNSVYIVEFPCSCDSLFL